MTNEKSDEYYKHVLEGKKVPTLVLDNRWHKLFSDTFKPKAISHLEESMNLLLKRQGKLNNEIKELKKIKTKLMDEIVKNMHIDGDVSSNDKKKSKSLENQKLILEINERININQDELLDIPRKTKEINELLIIKSMDYCYEKLHSNNKDIKEISDWIGQVRIELKKNIILRQEKKEKSTQIYSYMHDILGPEIIDIFDMAHKDNVE